MPNTLFYDATQRAILRHPGVQIIMPTGAHLIAAYNNGNNYRVKVRTTYDNGETFERWGYVALTTGPEPAFILMRSANSRSSSDVLHDTDQIIASHWK